MAYMMDAHPADRSAVHHALAIPPRPISARRVACATPPSGSALIERSVARLEVAAGAALFAAILAGAAFVFALAG